jgi:broad specificity phosphatase PhoE
MSSARHEPEFWLVRHGETEWSRNRRHTGRTDLPLAPEGEEKARELAPRLSAVRFDLVLSSPLMRARRTAELAGLTPVVEPLAVEWDYGRYEGRTTAQIRQEDPDWSVWTSPVPDGETLAEVAGRADALIDRVRSQAPRRAALVAHGHFLRVLTARWIEQDPGLGERFNLLTATVGVLGWDRGVPVVDRWNG